MAEKLDIHVVVIDGQTVSTFSVVEGGHVWFHNDAAANLSITFEPSVQLCDDPTKEPPDPILVDPGKIGKWKVCDGAGGKQFKYTATVENTNPEDPIVIFEGKKLAPDKGPINIFEKAEYWGIGGLLIGLIAGYLIARRMMARDRPRP